MRSLLHDITTLLRKDLQIELRTREIVVTMALFAVVEVVIFSFAFYTNEDRARAYAPGIIWVSVIFASTVGLARLFDRERESGAFELTLLSPVPPQAFYLSKVIGAFALTLVMELLAVPLVFLFFSLDAVLPLELVASLLLGTAGYCSLHALFAGALGATRMKEILVPLVVYPLAMPVVIAGVKVTGAALGGPGASEVAGWLRFMLGFDVLFLGLAAWLFERNSGHDTSPSQG
jgi:heme exporter protein CcmB